MPANRNTQPLAESVKKQTAKFNISKNVKKNILFNYISTNFK